MATLAPTAVRWALKGAQSLYGTVKQYENANDQAQNLVKQIEQLQSALGLVSSTENSNPDGEHGARLRQLGDKLQTSYEVLKKRLNEEKNKSKFENFKGLFSSDGVIKEVSEISREIHATMQSLSLWMHAENLQLLRGGKTTLSEVKERNVKQMDMLQQIIQQVADLRVERSSSSVSQAVANGIIPKIAWDNLRAGDGNSLNSENLQNHLLKQGDFGSIFQVQYPLLNEKNVALKILDIDADNLRGRCVCHQKVSHHANVVSFYGTVYPQEKDVGIVMELANGGSLSDALNGVTGTHWVNLPTMSKLRCLRGIISSIRFMHSLDVVHAEIKPHNILLKDKMKDDQTEPVLLISGFGLAKTVSSVENATGSTTPLSVNQDQREGGATIDLTVSETVQQNKSCKESDVFSLAVTIWSALSCEELFSGVADALQYQVGIDNDDVRPDIEKLPQDVPDIIKNLLQCAWDAHPGKRPSAAEFFYEWERALAEPVTGKEETDENDETLIFSACVKGHLDLVKHLVEECKTDVNTREGVLNRTPIFFACHGGHLQVVKYLVEECKVDVHTVVDEINEERPIFYACRYGHLDVVQYLIDECGVDARTVREKNDETPIFKACFEGHLDIVKYLVEKCNVDVNTTRDDSRRTPIFDACKKGHLDIVKYLVEKCNVNVHTTRDDSGRTPIFDARKTGHLDVVNYLVEECEVDSRQ